MQNKYDAILIVSFGGPEGMQDVMPFLENVTRGRNIPRERLLSVAHHYELFDGISPINEQNRQLISALEKLLAQEGPHLKVYWGNRNWHPLLPDTLQTMKNDGVNKAIAFVTAAYSSFSSCRQYLEDIESARLAIGQGAPEIDKVRAFYNHPAFIEVNAENLKNALEQIPQSRRENCPIAFTAHSIPESMANNCLYATQLQETCTLVASSLGQNNWNLVYQSKSGAPGQRWLEPDICDHIKELSKKQIRDLIVLPLGFISDHMEVIYDLDHEAKILCEELGINFVRATTAGTNPKFIEMIRALILEKIDPEFPQPYLGTMGPAEASCQTDCCPSGASRPLTSDRCNKG